MLSPRRRHLTPFPNSDSAPPYAPVDCAFVIARPRGLLSWVAIAFRYASRVAVRRYVSVPALTNPSSETVLSRTTATLQTRTSTSRLQLTQLVAPDDSRRL